MKNEKIMKRMKIYQEWEEFEEYGVTKLSLSAIAICH